MKKRVCLAAALIAAALMLSAAVLQREQQALADKLIRIHIVANSNSEEDQQVKLRIRDSILAVTNELELEDLSGSLWEIEEAARLGLRELDREDAVSVSLCWEGFPTRNYESFALPAGVYQTIRVTIGEGKGENWWCVAFPSLCFRASLQELKDAAVSAGFTADEVKLITKDGGRYVLKFKTLELLDKLKRSIIS